MIRRLMVYTSLIFVFSACNGKQNKVEQNNQLDTETLIRINRELVNTEVNRNTDYAKRHEWSYIKLENGVIYEVIEKGDGPLANSGDQVVFTYEMYNLKDQLIYSSNSSGPKKFIIDYNEIEAGLNELAKLSNEGDSIRMILPPHMAFGVPGDGNRVPARSSLVYFLKLESIQKQK